MSNELKEVFLNSLRKLDPDFQTHKYLLAVSGGADSVALARFVKEIGLSAIIAHCNFHLRGRESDEDAVFVEKLSDALQFQFVRKDFDTKSYASEHKLSIQMAARELRYQWFEELLNSMDLDYVLIAHHRDDQVETMLINLIRGTGIRGLSGMPEKTDKVLRPMLQMSRFDIETYLKGTSQSYRSDSSNAETKYLRNSIRHNLIPAFENIDKDFCQRMIENSDRFSDTSDLLDSLMKHTSQELLTKDDQGLIHIDITQEIVSPGYLFELLKNYGFNRDQINDLYSSETSGKQVYSNEYILLSDRQTWQLSPILDEKFREILIEAGDFKLEKPIRLSGRVQNAKDVKVSRVPEKAEVDMATLSFPLCIRKWKQGDVFQPLGMKGHQKLSDFFINRKLSVREKENVYLLCSGEDIVWVIGMQVSEKYKVRKSSQQLLCMQIQK